MPRAPAFIRHRSSASATTASSSTGSGIGHRLGRLDPGQRDQVLHQAGEPGRLVAHPAGETADRLRVVRGVLDRLGQQGQRADRGLELVADVGHEVAPDLLHPPALGLVLGQHQHQAAGAVGRAQRRTERGDANREAGRPVTVLVAGDLDLALADLAVPADLPGQREQLADQQPVALDQPERARGRAGAQHPVLAVEDHRGRGKNREDGGDPGGKPGRRGAVSPRLARASTSADLHGQGGSRRQAAGRARAGDHLNIHAYRMRRCSAGHRGLAHPSLFP